MDGAMEITLRHGKTLSASGRRPDDAPAWIDGIDNPYLHGLFAPTTVETSPTALRVEGELPRDLRGAYFRNGTNPRLAPKNRYHWFDGDGMVSGITFGDGRATFANRWIRTRGFEMEQAKGESIWPGVMGPFDFSAPLGPIKDTANTDLVFFRQRLLALWYESGTPYALDPRTLETVGIETLDARLSFPISAHSKVEPASGDFIFFSYGDRPPYYRYGVITRDGRLQVSEIELPGPRRPHDIGVSANWSIVHDFPYYLDAEHFKRTGRRGLSFHRDVPTRFGVLPRLGGNADLRWFECEPCYMLHTVNCWEEGDWLVQVGCRTNDPTVKGDPRDGELAGLLAYLTLQANLYEWRFNLKTGEVRERPLDTLNAEFPTINRRWMGRPNRYAYLQSIPQESPARFEGLVKYDLGTGRSERFDYGKGIFGSETVFAPRSGATAEDDGYLVGFVTDTNDWSSACWIFDARAITAGPIAKLALPQRLPAGFHALWVEGASLEG